MFQNYTHFAEFALSFAFFTYSKAIFMFLTSGLAELDSTSQIRSSQFMS